MSKGIIFTRDAAPPPALLDHDQPARADELDVITDALQQRGLIEPLLLLSAGYVAVPFFLRQVILLFAPLLALMGISLNREKAPHVLPQ